MASLYEIDQQILSCIDQETGEMIDFERFENLQMERNQKIENVALWIKNLQSDALAYKAEKESFAEREKAATNKIKRLKEYLTDALMGEKFVTAKCSIGFRRSEQVLIENDELVPKEFVKETIEYKPDKVAIKEHLKGGLEVSGCRLVESLNIQIK